MEGSTLRRLKVQRVTCASEASVYCPNLYRLSVSGARVAALSAGAALAAVFSPHQLHGQARDIAVSTGAITGAVRDSSGARLAGADLSIAGTTLRTVSDTAGRFRLVGVPMGAGTLQVRRLGYRAASVPVMVEDGATATITVTLLQLPQELDPVLVEARRQPGVRYLQGFYERRSKGHGYFVTREQIASRNTSFMTDVLRSLVPGVRISSSRLARNAVRLRGSRCAPLVWLDGAPAMAGEFDLDVLSPETVSGIEIYSGPATVPVEFRSTRGLEACGVIVVWSRVEAPEPREPRRKSKRSPVEGNVPLRVYTAEEVDTVARVDSTGMSEPVYPDSLYAFGVGGEVVAQFVVDTTGFVIPETVTAVSSTHAAFAESVQRALRRSKFRPAVLAGRRVRQVMVLPYRFVINDRG
jgi:TonB family protein